MLVGGRQERAAIRAYNQAALAVTSFLPAAGVAPRSLWGRLDMVSGWLSTRAGCSPAASQGQTEVPALHSGQGLGVIEQPFVVCMMGVSKWAGSKNPQTSPEDQDGAWKKFGYNPGGSYCLDA